MFPLSSLSEAEKVLGEISGYNVQVITSLFHFLSIWEIDVIICHCKTNNFGLYKFLVYFVKNVYNVWDSIV